MKQKQTKEDSAFVACVCFCEDSGFISLLPVPSRGGFGLVPFLEPVVIDGGQLDPADEGLAFAEAVAIGAAGDQQMMAGRNVQVVPAHRGGVFGMETLDAIQPGQRVVLVDDLLATGGTMQATIQLVRQLGGEIAGLAFAIELDFLKGRAKFPEYDVFSLLHYDE